MRIWLNPDKLKQYNLMPSDVANAITAQKYSGRRRAIGDLPVIDGQYLNTKVTAGSRLKTVEDFKKYCRESRIKRASYVYLKDIARVELGAENYQSLQHYYGYPAAGLGISLSSGANAIQTSKLIHQTPDQLTTKPPAGYKNRLSTR